MFPQQSTLLAVRHKALLLLSRVNLPLRAILSPKIMHSREAPLHSSHTANTRDLTKKLAQIVEVEASSEVWISWVLPFPSSSGPFLVTAS